MAFLRKLTAFPRLLVAGSPTTTDVVLLSTGIIAAIASGVPFPLIGIIFGQLLNDFNGATCDVHAASPSKSGGEYQSDINKKILVIVYLAIAQAVLIYAHLSCWSLTGARLAQRLRERYLETLLQQESAYFDGLPVGEVASRLDNDVQAVRSGTSEKVGICISSLSFFVTAYVVAFIKDATLAGMLVSLVPAYFLMSLVGGHYIEKYSGLMSEFAATAASVASEALNNVVVIHAFGANDRLEAKFSDALKSSEQEGLKKAAAVGVQAGLLYFIAYAANGLAFWQGSKQIADAIGSATSGATVGSVFTVIFVLVEATLLLSQVAPFLHLFTAAIASFNKLQTSIARSPLIRGARELTQHPSKDNGSFSFENLSFRYASRPDITVLDHVSFDIPSSKHTAIVGLSGSGKSTIASMIMRLYDPTGGRILFERQDLRDLNPQHLRGLISLVQQEPSLLDRSIIENIAYGLLSSPRSEHEDLKPLILGSDIRELATKVREGVDLTTAAKHIGEPMSELVRLVRQAAKRADADSFIISLKHGYGTQVGAAGRLISGGQKQRIALARALVKEPTILILDEATAALDSQSEQRIQRAISRLPNTVTILSIAHRLSTVINADNIIVMHAGAIVETGSHETLIALKGSYYNLVSLQGLGSSLEHEERSSHGEATASLAQTSATPSLDSEKAFPGGEEMEKDDPESGVAISSDEMQELETPPKSFRAIVRGYVPVLRPHLLVAIAAFVCATIVGGAFSAEAVIFGNTVGALSPCDSESSIRSRGNFFGLMFFVLALIELIANFVSWTGFGWVSEKTLYTVRVLSFRSLFQQDLQWHQSKGRTPALLLSYITRDGSALAGLSGSIIGTLFSITVNLIAAVILTMVIAWRIALVCLALVPLLLGAGLMELRVLGKFEEQHATAYTKSVDLGVEAAANIKTIASFCLEETIMQNYRASLQAPKKETVKVALQASFWQTSMYFLGNCVNALAYWWGAKQIIAGHYTQTQFLIVVFSLLVSALLWSQTFALAPELSSARAAMARLLGLIEEGSDGMRAHVRHKESLENPSTGDIESSAEKKTPEVAANAGAAIELRDIVFSYPARPDVRVLDGLSLSIRPGQFCALVGPSGSGKSTIISLIERMYAPHRGSISISGIDITCTRDVSFRDTIALVPQESVLFEGSVAFNVGLGASPGLEATMEEIKAACKLANIHNVIEGLPDGYDTLCGPSGNQFSGGQKQRLSIARALVRKPKVLILDEPTSALDSESERLLQEGLDQATGQMTVIAIAHRLHTIQRADVIFMIKGGKCEDQGTHEELLERSESYRANVTHQTIAQR